MTLTRASGATGKIAAAPPIPKLLRDMVQEKTGIYFDDDRLELMLEKLEPRAAALNCRSFLDYYYILKYDEKGSDEWRRVMDVFSVQETYFWRELDQVRVLVDKLVPAWFAKTSQPLRIWSAACATGEEPYSIAIALCEAGWGDRPIQIFASDASDAALVKARTCLYRERSFRSLPEALKQKYFEPRGEFFFLRPEISSRVSFHWANLIKLDDLPQTAAVEMIFCRNVFIYFSTASIQQVVAAFAARLPENGHLFVGASESLLKLTNQFELEEIGGAFVYRRHDAEVAP